MDVVSFILAKAMSGGSGESPIASNVLYDNIISGLLADNVQEAIDELSSEKISTSEKGSSGGVAELNENGIILTSQLPSYVDDVLEFNTFNDFPQEGESGKIYVDLSTNKTYRWGGSAYVEISESLALGETSSTAYRGDRGKIAYYHSQLTTGNPHNVTKAQVGLGNVDNTSDLNKPISTATQTALDAKVEEDDVEEIIYDVFNDTTVEGNPISFKVITGTEKAKSCDVAFAPKQDLHGYDHPWAGGNGKNQLDDTNTAISGNNMWFYGGGSTYKFWKAGTYTFSYEGNPNHNVSIYKKKDTDEFNSTVVDRNNTSATFTIPEDGNYRFFAQVTTGISASDCSKPMIEQGSTATSYAPYENICPISGWDGLNLTRTGKNLFGGETLCDYILDNVPNSFADKPTHRLQYSGSNITGITIFDKFKENTQYTFIFYGRNTNNNAKQVNMRVFYTDNTNDTLQFTTAGSDSYCVYTSTNGKTIANLVGVNGSQNTNLDYDKCGIFEGVKTVDDFEPYNGQTYPATFSDTIYGGSYDFVSGDGTANLSDKVDLGSLTWAYDSAGQRFYSSAINDMKSTEGWNNLIFYSENYKKGTPLSDGTGGDGIIGLGNKRIYIRNTQYTDAASFKTAMSGYYVCYELATPIEITLTGQEIVLNKGDNILFTDGDNIKLVASQIPSVTEIIDDDNISENHTFSSSKIDEFTEEKTYEILNDLTSDITKVGNPISVNMKFGNVLNKCNLTMNPIQDLHGYDAPWSGGNGKNKIGSTLTYIKSANTSGTWSGNNYTLNGVTFAVLVDSDDNVIGIKVTGMASERTDFRVGIPDLVMGTDYILNGCPANGSDSTYRLSCLYNPSGSAHDRGSGSETFTATGYEGAYCYIRIADGYSIATGGLTYYPMVRLATETDATFAPYSNICPISGRDSLNLENDPYYPYSVIWNQLVQDGNFPDISKWEANKSSLSVSNNVLTAACSENGYVSIVQKLSYAFAEKQNKVLRIRLSAKFSALTGSFNISISNVSINQNRKSFPSATLEANKWIDFEYIFIPTMANATVIRFGMNNMVVGDTIDVKNVQVTDLTTMFGSTIADYIYSLEQATTGSGVAKCHEYGIIKDFYNYNSGEETYMGLVNDEWHYSNSVTFPETVYGGTDEVVSGVGQSEWGYIASYNGETLPSEWISDRDVYAPNTTPTTGAEVAYKFATPTPFSTEPTNIELQKGNNVVSTDADGMSIKYTEMITIDDIKNIINYAIGSILNTEY